MTKKKCLKNPPPNITELDQQYGVYVTACDKLSEMRHADSPATQAQISTQMRLTEIMLQEWINSTNRFTATMN